MNLGLDRGGQGKQGGADHGGEFHRCVVSGLRMGWHKNAQLIVGWQAAALLAGRLSS